MTSFKDIISEFSDAKRTLSICDCRNWTSLEDLRPLLSQRLSILKDRANNLEDHFVVFLNIFNSNLESESDSLWKALGYDVFNDIIAHYRIDYLDSPVNFFCLNLFSSFNEMEICEKNHEELLSLFLWAESLGKGTVVQRMDIEL